MATDNLVWSLILNKGMSTKRGLTDIVLEIKVECHKRNVFFHPFHISGRRMILLGFDGLSRGDLDLGIMMGMDIRDLIPLDKTAFDV